MPEQS